MSNVLARLELQLDLCRMRARFFTGPEATGVLDDGHMKTALALDVGGTKLATAVVDAAGRIHGRSRIPMPLVSAPETVFEALLKCAHAALCDAGVRSGDIAGVGCGCGGPMRWPEACVSTINIPAWRNFPLRDRLLKEFDGVPVLVHNDAVALAAGEHWRGGGAGTTNMLAVTVSTGIGGGLILDKRLFHGTSGNAGHIGHVIVEPDGPLCGCGGRGCLESIASGPSTVRRALEEGWKPPEGVDPDGRALAQAAATGDPIAIHGLARAGHAVGLVLASCANLLDIQVAVIAGGFSQSGSPFWDGLRTAFAEHAQLTFARNMRILPSTIPGDAGLLGAAAFVLLPERYGWDADDRPSR